MVSLLSTVSLSFPALVPMLITLVVLGVCLWLIETKVPMDDTVKIVIRVVIVLAAVIWLLRVIGVMA